MIRSQRAHFVRFAPLIRTSVAIGGVFTSGLFMVLKLPSASTVLFRPIGQAFL